MTRFEYLSVAAASLGILSALLGIVNGISSMRERLRKSSSAAEGPTAPPVIVPHFRGETKAVFGGPWFVSSYLLREEVALIVVASLLLNYAGLAIDTQLKSVFYLDMSGTAFAAMLLGPWWGASVGMLSNLLNWSLSSDPKAATTVFPWLMVNAAGGLFWGLMARRQSFQRYITSDGDSGTSHFLFLFKFGVLGAGIMAIVGAFVLSALGPGQGLSLSPSVAEAINGITNHLEPNSALGLLVRSRPGSLAWLFLQNWFLYIPDKTISVATALGLIKFGFPLFQRELIGGGATRIVPRDNWVSPLVTGMVFLPLFVPLLFYPDYKFGKFWLLWAWPWLFISGGLGTALLRGPAASEVEEARSRRVEVYRRALKVLRPPAAKQFTSGLKVAALIASILFVFWVFTLEWHSQRDEAHAILAFFFVVYAFMFGMELILVMVRQNIGILRIGIRPPRIVAAVRSSRAANSRHDHAVIELQKPSLEN